MTGIAGPNPNLPPAEAGREGQPIPRRRYLLHKLSVAQKCKTCSKTRNAPILAYVFHNAQKRKNAKVQNVLQNAECRYIGLRFSQRAKPQNRMLRSVFAQVRKCACVNVFSRKCVSAHA